MGNANKGIRYTTEFKHEVCQFYENHTQNETMAKYGVGSGALWRWRTSLGYRNKHRNYNLYTEGLQPVMQKRERRDFMVTRSENGDLKAKVADLQYKLSAMELVVTQTLKGLGAEIESTLEAFNL
jgi:transposase-like protein